MEFSTLLSLIGDAKAVASLRDTEGLTALRGYISTHITKLNELLKKARDEERGMR